MFVLDLVLFLELLLLLVAGLLVAASTIVIDCEK